MDPITASISTPATRAPVRRSRATATAATAA